MCRSTFIDLTKHTFLICLLFIYVFVCFEITTTKSSQASPQGTHMFITKDTSSYTGNSDPSVIVPTRWELSHFTIEVVSFFEKEDIISGGKKATVQPQAK